MLHSIASLTNTALAIVGEIWTAARDRTVPWNAHLVLDQYVCDVTEVQQNRPQEELDEDFDPWHGKLDNVPTNEEVRQIYLASLDADPRFADPFARPDWNGDPNEY